MNGIATRAAASLLLFFACLLSVDALAQGAAAKTFFKPVAAAKSAPMAKGSPLLQDIHTEMAPVRFNAAEMLALRHLEEIELALPNGRRYDVVFELARSHGAGVHSWIGHFKSRGTQNRVILTTGPGGSFGVLDTPEGSFRVLPGGEHDWLVDMSAEERFVPPIDLGVDYILDRSSPKAKVDPRNATLVLAEPGINVPSLPKATPPAVSVIDIMFVVTQGLANRLGNNLLTRLQFLIARANTSYTDSAIGIQLRFVNYTVVNYPDDGNDAAALNAITPDLGSFNAVVFGNVEAIRSQYGADMVTFLRDGGSFSGTGIAWVPFTADRPNRMYSTVNGCVSGCEFVWIHEVGHNMGNMHDRHTVAWEDGGVPADQVSQGLTPYAYGYAFCRSGALSCNPNLQPGLGGCASNTDFANKPECSTNDPSNFSDIMAYFHGSTQRLYRFSNPAVTCVAPGGDGIPRPCGVNSALANSADAATSMNASSITISAMKADVPVIAFAQSAFSGSETGGTITFTVSRSGNGTGAVAVSYATSSGTATSGIDFAAASGTLNWGPGDTANKTFTVNLVDDQAVEGIETFNAVLSAPTGGAVVGQPSTATGRIEESWPPGGTLPAGWTAASGAPWAPATDSFDPTGGDGTSLKSGPIAFLCPPSCNPEPPVPVPSATQFSGSFLAGTISFAYKVDSYPGNGFFEFLIDGVVVASDSGDTGWRTYSGTISAGAHTLQWRFRPTLYFPCSQADPEPPQGINCADRAWIDSVSLPLAVSTSTTTLASSMNPSSPGQAVTITATLGGSAGERTGTVTFRDNGADIAGCVNVVVAANAAACTTSALVTGSHPITATYSGSMTYGPSVSSVLSQVVSGPLPLTVNRNGSGTGTVSSNPAGINCGATCNANFASGSAVVLTATAGAASVFAGWSGGGCSGIGTCTVTMAAATTVTATFQSSTQPAGTSVAPGVADFGGQSINTTSPAQAITLGNTGGAPLTVSGASSDNAQFAASTACASVPAGGNCIVNVTFTPTAEGSVLATLSIATSAGTVRVFLAGSGERSLVTHYYRSILRRAPDAGGKGFWEGERERVVALGANVNETWFSMAQSFYGSAEYLAFNRDDTGFVTDLYNTFFNRPPDAGGLAFWVGQLQQGMPREVALVSFMFSQEFANFTQAIFGNTAVRAEINTVVDFYRGLLSRLPDDGGFGFWRGQFRAAQCQGAAAVTAQAEAISSAFALSAEYAQRARSNAQYVGDLYNAFLRRGGDLGGVLFWIGEINSGARTRENVRQQFVASPEFQGRVQAIIAAGCLP